MKNLIKIMGTMAPDQTGRYMAKKFLSPRRFERKSYELEAETTCERLAFGGGLSAARWGHSGKKVLLMHGWEGRATQMAGMVFQLVKNGFEVTALDGPGHGESADKKANPVTFGEAVFQAQEELGPFWGAVGHSMGAAAVAVAMDKGARFNRIVLIASPAGIYDTLCGFANFVGLPKKSAGRFIHHVEKEVGISAKYLDVKRIFAQVKPEALLIHALNDREVPYAAMQQIASVNPDIQVYTSADLGHRRIIKSDKIARITAEFLGEKDTAKKEMEEIDSLKICS